jgi:serine/threonine-protein kinase RsbW
MKAPPSLLRLASGKGAAARLHEWLDEALASEPISERMAYAIRLCLEEAITNVMMHGYGPEGGPIEVALWREPDGFEARVVDEAKPFDPTTPPPPPPRNTIEAGPLGGRGLVFMHRFASGMGYRRVNGRNELALRFVG